MCGKGVLTLTLAQRVEIQSVYDEGDDEDGELQDMLESILYRSAVGVPRKPAPASPEV